MTEERREQERQTGYWLGVIDNNIECLRLQHGQPSMDLNLFAWDVQAINTALVRLSLDLRNPDESRDTTAILTRGLVSEQGREIRVKDLAGLSHG